MQLRLLIDLSWILSLPFFLSTPWETDSLGFPCLIEQQQRYNTSAHKGSQLLAGCRYTRGRIASHSSRPGVVQTPERACRAGELDTSVRLSRRQASRSFVRSFVRVGAKRTCPAWHYVVPGNVPLKVWPAGSLASYAEKSVWWILSCHVQRQSTPTGEETFFWELHAKICNDISLWCVVIFI